MESIHNTELTEIVEVDSTHVIITLTEAGALMQSKHTITCADISPISTPPRARSVSFVEKILSRFKPPTSSDELNESLCTELDLREVVQRGDLGWSDSTMRDVRRYTRTDSDAQYIPLADNDAPTWKPMYPFSHPINLVPITIRIPNNLTLDDFTDVKKLSTPGSNAKIMYGRYNGNPVVIKIIKRDSQVNLQANHEFETEHGILCRLQHPNIIRIIGAGWFPRRFIVLEYLGGGSLSSRMKENILSRRRFKLKQSNIGCFPCCSIFKDHDFSYERILNYALELANALQYLHMNVHDEASIIHRDLKPDNIGFNDAGNLILFDMGLCCCVKKISTEDDCYKMTGTTGSLRYMAPEVALQQSYNCKVDVYSFGVIVWQMASGKVPFEGLGRIEFMQRVVNDGERPVLDKSWPNKFKLLLERCWHSDATKRPHFCDIILALKNLLKRKDWRFPGMKQSFVQDDEVVLSNDFTSSRESDHYIEKIIREEEAGSRTYSDSVIKGVEVDLRT